MSRRAQWYQVFKQSRISVISVVLVISIFILSDQAQDVLRSLAQPGVGGKIILFEILLWIWAFTNWYGARFLLDHDFQAIRRNQKSQMRPRSLWGENFMPRFLGSAGLVGLGFALLYAVTGLHDINDMHYERVRWLGWINIPGSILFYFLVTVRRTVFQHLSAFARRTRGFRWVPAYSPRIARVSDFSEFPLWFRIVIIASVTVSLLVWVLIFFSLQRVAPLIGSAAIIFLAWVFLTIFGTGLVWLGERYHVPMLVITFLYAGIIGIWNDNHAVRQLLISSYKPSQDFTAGRLFDSWLAKMDADYPAELPHPMFIVAASGGGIRAAYWTAIVLGHLQEQKNSFANHTLIISPVSGGALGSIVFANLIIHQNEVKGNYVERSREILSQDFLSPSLGALFFYDVPLRFWPFPNQIRDRAQALEVAWERAWISPSSDPKRIGFSPQVGGSPFEKGFSDLRKFEQNHTIPTLLINGTSVDKGQRILTTHLSLAQDFPDCENAFQYLSHDIRMSTAAMMSARFTYVSPAGTLESGNQVVDGGYYENSGAATALQFYEAIESEVHKSMKVIPVFIQIDNDYVTTQEESGKITAANEQIKESRSWRIFPEIQAPITTLLNTRNAHAVSYLERAKKKFGENYYHYIFSLPGKVKAPLGWFLSRAAQEGINEQLSSNDASENSKKIANYISD